MSVPLEARTDTCSPELEFQMVCAIVQVVGTKPQPTGKGTRAHNCWAIPPAPVKGIYLSYAIYGMSRVQKYCILQSSSLLHNPNWCILSFEEKEMTVEVLFTCKLSCSEYPNPVL